MSPALTRENSKDVDSKEDFCQSNLATNAASIVSSLTKPFFFQQSVKDGNESINGKINDTKLTQTSSNGKFTVDVKATASNGHGDHSDDDRTSTDSTMTPRIVLQCISAASSKSASVSQNVEAHGGQLHKNSMSPLLTSKLSGRPDLKSIAPSIEDVSKKQTQMEREICDVLKRITHLQGILATRHSKQQIKGFVESCMSVASQNSPGSTHSSIPLEVMNSPPDAPSIRNQLISHNMGVCENSSAYTCKVEKLFESTEDGLEHIRLKIPDRASSSSTNPTVKKKIETDIKMSSSSLRQLQMDIDSEVTDSSSGDDMDDEPSQGLSMAPSRSDM